MRSWAPQACLSAWREPPDEALVSLHDVHTFATARYSQSVSHSLRRLWAVARRCVIAGATAAPAGGCARLVFRCRPACRGRLASASLEFALVEESARPVWCGVFLLVRRLLFGRRRVVSAAASRSS